MVVHSKQIGFGFMSTDRTLHIFTHMYFFVIRHYSTREASSFFMFVFPQKNDSAQIFGISSSVTITSTLLPRYPVPFDAKRASVNTLRSYEHLLYTDIVS
jgi:hypothetical protein